MSAGWSCYCWLLGRYKDDKFSEEKLSKTLDYVLEHINEVPERTKYSMNNFVYTLGLSYIPLSDKAKELAEQIGELTIQRERRSPQTLNALESLQKELDKGRLGFKRKYVRC